jgi:hypothetical protein
LASQAREKNDNAVDAAIVFYLSRLWIPFPDWIPFAETAQNRKTKRYSAQQCKQPD